MPRLIRPDLRDPVPGDDIALAGSVTARSRAGFQKILGFRKDVDSVRLVIVFAALALSAAILFVSEPRLVFADYRIAYYPAGSAILNGQSLRPLIERGVTGFVNIPIIAWLFAPLALFPVALSAGVFLLCGIAASALACVLLIRVAGLTGWRSRLFVLLFAANGPLLYSVKEGNTSHIVLACLVGGLVLVRRGRNGLAGVLLASAALMKLPLLLFGLYFVARRNWSAAAAFAVTLFAAVSLSLLVFGPALHAVWFDVAVRQFSGHSLAAFNVQSLQSFVLRLRTPAPALFDWHLLRLSRAETLVCTLVAVAFCLTTAFICLRTMLTPQPKSSAASPDPIDLEFMLVVCLALLTSPLSWTHYYAWMLIPVAFFIGGRFTAGSLSIGSSPGPLLACVVATLLVSLPVVFPTGVVSQTTVFHERLGASTYFLGGILWFSIIAVTANAEQRRRIFIARAVPLPGNLLPTCPSAKA